MPSRHGSRGSRPDGERGLSPVMGIVLLISITIILSAIVGTFNLALGVQKTQSSPIATIEIEDAPGEYETGTGDHEPFVRLTHEGGDDVVLARTSIAVRTTDGAVVVEWNGGRWTDNAEATRNGGEFPGEFSTGDIVTVSVESNGGIPADDATYRVVVVDLKTGSTIADAEVHVR